MPTKEKTKETPRRVVAKKEPKKKTIAPKIEERAEPVQDSSPVKAGGDLSVYDGRYYYGLGRRKTAVAQVRLFTKGLEKKFLVNGVECKTYFKLPRFVHEAESPLKVMKAVGKFAVEAKVNGGGVSSQAGAVRLGIARALVEFNKEFRKRLRRQGYLTRDPRMVERKKYGLKKARKAPQWSKR